MRVLIIGAGLGGLCLAQALAREDVDVRVYERESSPASRYQGFRIGLDPSGLQALHHCLPERLHPLLHACTAEVTGEGHLLDHQLHHIKRLDNMPAGRATDRNVLRSLLMSGLHDRVEFGKTLTRYREHPDGTVSAVFTDTTTATGDLLVGADGINSRVRHQLLPHAEIADTRARLILARTPLTDRFAALAPQRGTVIRGPLATMVLHRMQFPRPPHLAAHELAPGTVLPPTPDYLRWSLYLPPHHPAPPPHTTLQQTALDLITHWHPDLIELVSQTDTINNTPLPIRYAKPVAHWATRPVTLIGDAIHAMPPTSGQGANDAFRDAADLHRTITRSRRDRTQLLTHLQTHEQEMLHRGFTAISHGLSRLPLFTHAPAPT